MIAGNGGDGSTSFRREAFVPKGGPDGGDGGRGGDLYLRADHNCNTLARFRSRYKFHAEHGCHGQSKQCTGKSGQELEIIVPPGTIVRNDDQELIGDLLQDGTRMLVATGGKGGLGNVHFKSSTNRTPRKATAGKTGDKLWLNLELALLGDVGLVGLPNAGKSTFLAAVTNAKPKIADYPFTTLIPNLGICDLDMERSLLIADIPGLIAGAAEGAGLGHQFLRHIRRTSTLLFLLDSVTGPEQVRAAWDTLNGELETFDPDLMKKKKILALNKTDATTHEQIQEVRASLPADENIVEISAVTGSGVRPLLEALWRLHADRDAEL